MLADAAIVCFRVEEIADDARQLLVFAITSKLLASYKEDGMEQQLVVLVVLMLAFVLLNGQSKHEEKRRVAYNDDRKLWVLQRRCDFKLDNVSVAYTQAPAPHISVWTLEQSLKEKLLLCFRNLNYRALDAMK